jgi:hypothetical protein
MGCLMPLSRRALLLATGAAALGAPAADAAAAPPDGADPAVIDRWHRKLVYALDDRPVFWWKLGTKYGVVDGEVTPLWGMQVFFVQQVRAHREREFDVASLEIVFLTDLATGALLDRWRNPYTGETLPVPNRVFGPEVQTLTSVGGEVASEMPGSSIRRRHSFGPATVVGDDVWLPIDTASVVTRRSAAGRPFRVSDLETYHGRLADLERERVRSAPATAVLHIISSWQGWLNMDARPGSQVTRLNATKAFAMRDVPASIRALLAAHYPTVLAAPLAALDRPPETFER